MSIAPPLRAVPLVASPVLFAADLVAQVALIEAVKAVVRSPA